MNIKLLSDYAKIPTKGTMESAGWDLYAALHPLEQMSIEPGECQKIPTDIAMEIPYGCFGAIFPRSGLATKDGLRLANCVAVIDSDYRGNVMVPLFNDSNDVKFIEPGQRIAQLVIIPYSFEEMFVVDELSNTARGDGGFGSTGRD